MCVCLCMCVHGHFQIHFNDSIKSVKMKYGCRAAVGDFSPESCEDLCPEALFRWKNLFAVTLIHRHLRGLQRSAARM